ncbi:MAG: hypothetical protein MR279_04985, partial [Bacteroidales bacterium]|nr:hypothetical protein [Bacteroidales bacterium]
NRCQELYEELCLLSQVGADAKPHFRFGEKDKRAIRLPKAGLKSGVFLSVCSHIETAKAASFDNLQPF